jgi:hypothetical protein
MLPLFGAISFYKWYLFEIYVYLFVRYLLIFHVRRKKCEQIIYGKTNFKKMNCV